MNTAQIDKNLQVETSINIEDIIWFDAQDFSPIKVYGALGGTKPYARMDLDVAKSINAGIYGLSKNCAGIRLRFRTNSPYIAIKSKWSWLDYMPHMPLSGSSGFDLYTYKNGRQELVGAFMPPMDCKYGYESVRHVSGEMTDYILNFPHYNDVDALYIGVKNGCDFEEPAKYINEKPVVYYGSSITQGGCATRPGNSYQNFLSREFDMDYINLGFSGSGRGEDAIINYLKDLDMSVFVSDYDYNAPDDQHLYNTHYKLYKGVREKHPNIPYIILTKPDYKFYAEMDDKRRLAIFETYKKALAEGDKNVYLIDGATLFAGDEWDACTVDACHPNDLGFYRIAEALKPVFSKIF